MEKISKEKLMEEMKIHGLSDDEIEKITGGQTLDECVALCESFRGVVDVEYCKYCCSFNVKN